MFIFSIIIQSLLLAYYLFSGTAKVIGAKYWADIFAHLGLSQRLRVVTGIIQLIGAVALSAGYWYNGATAWAGVWLGVTMLVAILIHLKVRDSFSKIAPALVFAALNIIIVSINANHLSSLF
ncbi:DoxX family protein [Bacillus sp. FJAT-49736]|uniref:DoxX family protein n=1 Tax=Bacillus sp. FJAT-49736 TaxID=2833582 RepID=UPI001BC8F6B4|nr:DoxX family protein [Bacillus sp. FJAT-49736]MBS4172161.1 DoxX family protein [Bacillus sp. FJAT-49736]